MLKKLISLTPEPKVESASILTANGILPGRWEDILGSYDAFLVDVFGVLRRHDGPIRSAINALSYAIAREKHVFIVSNTCDESPENVRKRHANWGLNIPGDQIYTSGMLLKDYFAKNSLTNKLILVLGTGKGSEECVQQAEGIVFDKKSHDENKVEAIVVAYERYDDDSFHTALNLLMKNPQMPLIVPNTDILVPFSPGKMNVGSASIAVSLTAILKEAEGITINPVLLGKPHLYEKVYPQILSKLSGFNIFKEKILIIGDTLRYDIAAAKMLNIHSLLVLSGSHAHLSHQKLYDKMTRESFFPTYWMPVLSP